jgi:hypothetical protein
MLVVVGSGMLNLTEIELAHLVVILDHDSTWLHWSFPIVARGSLDRPLEWPDLGVGVVRIVAKDQAQ